MTGIEIAAGYALAWLFRKGRRVAGQLDGEVDRGLDAGVQRVHELVSSALGEAPALVRARQEAEAGQPEPSEQTRQQLVQAIAERLWQDPEFGEQLRQAVAALQSGQGGQGGTSKHTTITMTTNNGVVADHIETITLRPQPPNPPRS
ncbi:hypothetical protein GCM10009738_37150 [Kitasatospora viridis]|uniref:Chromosome partitioning protein n=2 Tax=Kitasatospora viridis TaxID=281105 RepID=A0A561UDC9_9ACTN|nr:hypothetical protein FHX73_111136 [Kitasatospora viridis]